MFSTVPAYILALPTSNPKPDSHRIPGEYKMKHATAYHQFGPLPGLIQYAVPREELCSIEIPNDPNEHNYPDVGGKQYILTEHTAKNKMRTIPITIPEQDIQNQHLILCMKHETPNGEIWLKSAYLNLENQTVSLITSTNCRYRLTRPITTHAGDGWYVGQYYMCAPLAFWRELKNRLVN